MQKLNFCPRAIIFDMDGLLIDSEPVWEKIEDAILSARGVALTPEIRHRYVGTRMDDFWGGLRADYNLSDPLEALIQEAIDRMVARVGVEAAQRPGAPELIAFVEGNGLRAAIASSSPLAIIDAAREAHGWQQVFATRVSGDDVPHGKPAPDIYLEAARRLGVDPHQCLALEDSPNGARAAVAAGMITIAVPDAAHTTHRAFETITPYIYDSLHDVRAALEECDFAGV